MGYWKYNIVHDYNATQLIKEFREENEALKNSKGTEDEELDFIIYAEKDDHTISLGRVLLVKMSDAMVQYYYQYKLFQPSFNLPNFWAEHIYEQNKNNDTFQFNQKEIADAFLESVKLQKDIIADVSVLDAENFIKKVLENISDNFRNDEKFNRKQWDPTLESDEYLLKKNEKPVNYLIEKCDSSIITLTELKEQLELFRDFKLVGNDVKLVEKIIDVNNEIINGITAFKNYLIENRNDARKELAFLCGVWDGSVEFIAGFIDLGLLAFNITINDLPGVANLEYLSIREGVEEALGAILKDPKKFFTGIIDAVENYKHTRYDDPNLNEYQKFHNAGEDLILTVDLVVTVVTFVKGIAKLAKQLPKFTKWIEEVFARGGKGARKVLSRIIYTDEDLAKIVLKYGLKLTESDIKTVLKLTKGRADLCESIILSTKEILVGKNIEQLVKYFKLDNLIAHHSLGNYQVRIWYTWKKAGIEWRISHIKEIEKRALKAFELRNQFRTEARKYMKDRVLADYLEEVEKNMEWETLLQKTLKKDKVNSLEEAYKYIIETSKKGRDEVDVLFKIEK